MSMGMRILLIILSLKMIGLVEKKFEGVKEFRVPFQLAAC
jgi:hypothetical protein